MSAVIELVDSDDEHPMNDILSSDLSELSEIATSNSMDYESTICEFDTVQGRISIDPLRAIGNIEDETNIMPASSKEQTRARVHRRKSSHQTVRSSPDMEFAMFPVEFEIDANTVSHGLMQKRGARKTQKRSHNPPNVTPNILQSKPTLAEIVNAEFEDFLTCSKTRSIIRDIAIERLRINTLLTLNGMPEINFSLYAKPERLAFQLKNRFMQRKMQQQNDGNALN